MCGVNSRANKSREPKKEKKCPRDGTIAAHVLTLWHALTHYGLFAETTWDDDGALRREPPGRRFVDEGIEQEARGLSPREKKQTATSDLVAMMATMIMMAVRDSSRPKRRQ